jgi:hypothetical protein
MVGERFPEVRENHIFEGKLLFVFIWPIENGRGALPF